MFIVIVTDDIFHSTKRALRSFDCWSRVPDQMSPNWNAIAQPVARAPNTTARDQCIGVIFSMCLRRLHF